MSWWLYALFAAGAVVLLAWWIRRRIQNQIDAVLRHKRLP